MTQQVAVLDGYSDARNGNCGFVGWASYRGNSLGIHSDPGEGTVTVWPASDPSVEWVLDADHPLNRFSIRLICGWTDSNEWVGFN